jgi:hypothetical protein
MQRARFGRGFFFFGDLSRAGGARPASDEQFCESFLIFANEQNLETAILNVAESEAFFCALGLIESPPIFFAEHR